MHLSNDGFSKVSVCFTSNCERSGGISQFRVLDVLPDISREGTKTGVYFRQEFIEKFEI